MPKQATELNEYPLITMQVWSELSHILDRLFEFTNSATHSLCSQIIISLPLLCHPQHAEKYHILNAYDVLIEKAY